MGTSNQTSRRVLSGKDGRRHARHHTDMFKCHLGQICDVSVSGMRVSWRGRAKLTQGQVGMIELKGAGVKLRVKGRVQWVKRSGFMNYEAGVQFLDIAPATATALNSIAMFGFIPKDWSSAATPKGGASTSTKKAGDYYQVLGVRPDATDREIHKAFREVARIYHPDHNKSPTAEARFIEAQQAYSVLKDPDKRRKYDEYSTQGNNTVYTPQQ